MFSPYYAWARRRAKPGKADPHDHCAINIATYGRGGSRWAMTERGRRQVARDARNLRIGPSRMEWTGDSLHIELNEITVPWPSRLRGRVTLHAERRFSHSVELAPGHRWFPIAPSAHVEVELGDLRWSGRGYLDSNNGDEPLETAFRHWEWSRAMMSGGRSAVFYDVDRISGAPLELGLLFNADGSVLAIDSPPSIQLPPTFWRMSRRARTENHAHARVIQTLTDAPFYARSLLRTHCFDESVTAVHESLSMTRFKAAHVQAMLPFRMPRWSRSDDVRPVARPVP